MIIHKDFYRVQTLATKLGHFAKTLIVVEKGKTLSDDGHYVIIYKDTYRVETPATELGHIAKNIICG